MGAWPRLVAEGVIEVVRVCLLVAGGNGRISGWLARRT